MTTQTRALPDLDEALDFEPTCQSKRGCDHRAEWSGQLECGCDLIILCAYHKADVDRTIRSWAAGWTCNNCGADIFADDVTWRPL